MDDVTTFFADQAARVRGGAFFGKATTAAEAIGRAERSMRGLKFSEPRMARAQVAAGRVWVMADDGASRFATGLLGILPKTLQDAFAAEVVPWARQVIEEWPVKTGRSRSAIALEVDEADGFVTWTLLGAAPYTYFIKYARKAKGAPTEFAREVYAYVDKRMRAKGGSVSFPTNEILGYASKQFGSTVDEVRQMLRNVGAANKEAAQPVYRLPGGGDAKGWNAWQAQATIPFRPMFARLSDKAGLALARNARAFTVKSR